MKYEVLATSFSVCADGCPVLSLAVSPSHRQCTVGILSIANSAFPVHHSFLRQRQQFNPPRLMPNDSSILDMIRFY